MPFMSHVGDDDNIKEIDSSKYKDGPLPSREYALKEHVDSKIFLFSISEIFFQ